MFDIGFLELMVVAILGLLVLGPERLPKAARSVGLLLGKVRRTVNNVQDELERQVRAEELREKLKDPYATFLDDDENTIRPHQTAPSGSQKPDAPDQPRPTVTAATVTDTTGADSAVTETAVTETTTDADAMTATNRMAGHSQETTPKS